MRPSGRLFANSVTVRATSWHDDGTGVRTPSRTAEQRRCSVQPMRVGRAQLHGLDGSRTAYTLLLPAPDPGVEVGDVIEWQGRTLSVLGPALDQAGRGAMWAVDCVEKR